MIESILFVCTGNMCRSPMAEGLMKHKLNSMGINTIRVKSAGVMTRNGMPASDYAITTLSKMGIDIRQHKTTMLNPVHLDSFSLIIAMEYYHKDLLISVAPGLAKRIKLLKEYSPEIDSLHMEVLDPIGKDLEDYRRCAYEISNCLEEMIKKENIRSILP